MKEKELRRRATCSVCGNKILASGVPLFWRVKIERFGLIADAIQRQQGLTMMLGGNAMLAQVMGPDEDMAKPVMDPVTLVGVVDGMNGLTVRDYKLTTRFDAERYADSYQWRSYLEMFGAKKFVYDVFVGKEDEPGEYIIYDYHKLSFYAYDGMKRDIELEVDGLAQIVAKHIPEAA